jgi:hypothetical protein
MTSYYHDRSGNILGGWYVEGQFYGQNRPFNDDDPLGGIQEEDVSDLLYKTPRANLYRVTITGVPKRDSPETGNPNYNPYADPPISLSYKLSYADLEDATYESEGGTAEDIVNYILGDEDGWRRVDRLEIVDTTVPEE